MVHDGQLEFADFVASSGRTLYELEAALLYDVRSAGIRPTPAAAVGLPLQPLRAHATTLPLSSSSPPSWLHPYATLIITTQPLPPSQPHHHCRPLHPVNITIYTTPSPRHQSTLRPPQQRRLFQPPWRAVGGGSATTADEEITKPPKNLRFLAYFSMHGGASRRQTTIVVAVGRRYSHHSRTMWCRAVMTQPLVKHRVGQLPKTTTVVAAEPTLTTTAAPWWCRACGGICLLAWMGRSVDIE
nr:hypothetical protein [Tanacetum cinerariifolium]